MELSILQKFGLTKNEARVYLTLLKMGSALAGEITKTSGIHRRNVYDSIERLIKKGLISFVIKNNRKYFHATDPESFLGIIEQEKQELINKETEFKKILPELTLSKSHSEIKQDVYFFKGPQGLKYVYEDILRTGKSYIGYGSGDTLERILKAYFAYFKKERIKKKMHIKLIYDESIRGKPFTKTPLAVIRYMPKEYSSHAALRIYGDKVAILLLSKEEPLAIIVDNKEIADGYKKYFEFIWKAAKK